MERSTRLDELKPRLRPSIEELGELKRTYALGGDPREFAARREEAHREFSTTMDRLNTAFESFNDLRKDLDKVKLQVALGKMLSGRQFSKSAPKEFADSQYWDRYRQESADFIAEALKVQSDEMEAYKNALGQWERERASRRMLAAAALAALAALAAFLWLRRRAARAPATLFLTEPSAAPAEPPALSLLEAPGAVLGDNFRVEREIGRGGMGVVYEATDLSLGRRVAIKRMHESLTGSDKDLQRFLAEACSVAALRHPNIVQIYDNFRVGDRVYLVFELVDGRPLSALLGGRMRLPLQQIKEIVRQTGEALDHAHSHRVIHKDLKPANIMLASEGLVKIMDFGIAHQASLTVARSASSARAGTPPYMAPEQELGSVSRESDLFSLGVVLYEMLTGRLPFTGPNFLAQKQRRLAVPPSRLAPGLPLADQIIAKALAPEPRDRYHSGAELAAAVDALG